MNAVPNVLTTGQVAKICKVAPRTVAKWFDSGRLKGYRIPGSQDRRILRENLEAFLIEHGIPLNVASGLIRAEIGEVGEQRSPVVTVRLGQEEARLDCRAVAYLIRELSGALISNRDCTVEV